MPAGQRGQQRLELGGGDAGDDVVGRRRRPVGRPVGVEALDVGEHDELLGAERHRERGGGGVGVDVVDLAAGAAGDAGDDRDPAVGEQALHHARVDLDDVADQAEVDLLAVDLEAVAARR